MKPKLLLCMVFFLGVINLHTQTISGKIMHSNTFKVIENAAIKTNLNKGTTSDKNGNYSLDITHINSVTFSCLGFHTKTISKAALIKLNYKIYLDENFMQLDEIELLVRKISVDSILIKTAKNMNKNYIATAVKEKMYVIESNKMDFKKIDLELKSSSLLSRNKKKLATKELQKFAKDILSKKPEFRSEFACTFSSQQQKNNNFLKTFFIDSIQGYKTTDIGNGINLKNITTTLQNIVLKYLNPTTTYKVKSGIFTIEKALSLEKVIQENDSIEKSNSFNRFRSIDFKHKIENKGQFFKSSSETNFLDKKYYNHHLEKNETLGNHNYYVVSFTPRKSKAKFCGAMYIDPEDYTIKKISYQFADGKRGQHLNLKLLLGLKFSENINKTTLFYEKNRAHKIYTSYYNESKTLYTFVDRPIKLIENAKPKQRVKFNIKVVINVTDSKEVFLKDHEPITLEMIKPLKKEELKKRIKYLTENEYHTSDWKKRKVILEYLKQYE